jgi:hypothetical protein
MEKNTFNFYFLGNYDVTNLKKQISLLTEKDWLKYTGRQDVYEAHRETLCIPVLFDINYFNKMGEKTDYYNLFQNEIQLINEHINKQKSKNGQVIRFEIVKMPAKTKIPTHKDNTPSLVEHSRIHLPIQTADQVFFKINDEEKNLKEGEMWEINNVDIHSVTNNSGIDRIHIIIDWKKNASKLI